MELIWIKEAKYLGNYKFSLVFGNGEKRVFNLNELMEKDRRYRDFEMFKPLKDEEFVKNFSLDGWTICFSNGIDIAPEEIYKIAI